MSRKLLGCVFILLSMMSSKQALSFQLDITADASLMSLIESYAWNVPLVIDKIEQSDAKIKSDPAWSQIASLISSSKNERQEARSKLLEDLVVTESFEKKKELAEQFVVESQKQGDLFFEKISDLIDPLQQKESLKHGHLPSTNWMYDPLTYYLIEADDKALERAREMQISRLMTAMTSWKKAYNQNASPDERNKSTFAIAMLNLDNSIASLELLNPNQRAAIVELIFTEGGTISASENLDNLSQMWDSFAGEDSVRAVLQSKVKRLRKIITDVEKSNPTEGP